jgi:hypothetical protein
MINIAEIQKALDKKQLLIKFIQGFPVSSITPRLNQVLQFNGRNWVPANLILTGEKGDKGDQGTPGVGIPVGGTEGQILTKVNSTNYNVQWSDIFSILNDLPSFANDEEAILAGLIPEESWYILNNLTDIGTPWTLRRVGPAS